VALGAVLIALRMKGETVEELAGMMDALAGHLIPIRMPARRALPLVIPTYNGARKLPNLLPLLAMKVAREGIPVRVWVWPGNTNDMSVIGEVKDDLRGWRLGRGSECRIGAAEGGARSAGGSFSAASGGV